MSKHLVAVISIILLLTGYVVYQKNTDQVGSQPANQATGISIDETFVVTLTSDGYEPAEFTIPVGTAVTFKSVTGKPHWPASNLHPTHEIYAEFDPRVPLEPDETWTFVFNKVGDWNFHDHIKAFYTGTVHVTP